MTKVNKPPTTSNPNIKLKKPNSKEEEDFNQPVKKTVIAKNIKVVKKPEDINTTPKKSENESAEKDQAKKEVNSTDAKSKTAATDSKGKSGTDSNSQKNADASKNAADNSGGDVQLGYFSWLWRYFPKKKT
ncbi:conserved Plasmodium protein, unknown function [Plasmodium vivax]|uniref:(malaria parasite P. vivax) hypothetical protein n=1 Tax=Plasmodium vivax TaxID=5855 RepID=A0A1G4GTD6_PLAVI|nr:unnamed protein product [Plasmodium vivax]CAI7718810.1 conserved Plasmodium protein, unknown function [Plasmodium vivax]SCO65857.1 conserved Plasmodium protein, unknown function [Plasmodium vivax]SCO71285.1 conserved Plasmodium protein, unknown function [Plasmodium vivax]VUZ94021.1 conserved Plasmodium protein, unknown function [Plasmodium vivax]